MFLLNRIHYSFIHLVQINSLSNYFFTYLFKFGIQFFNFFFAMKSHKWPPFIIGNIMVKIYDKEKSVCDAIRFRNKV